jgi:hypothetical protein
MNKAIDIEIFGLLERGELLICYTLTNSPGLQPRDIAFDLNLYKPDREILVFKVISLCKTPLSNFIRVIIRAPIEFPLVTCSWDKVEGKVCVCTSNGGKLGDGGLESSGATSSGRESLLSVHSLKLESQKGPYRHQKPFELKKRGALQVRCGLCGLCGGCKACGSPNLALLYPP